MKSPISVTLGFVDDGETIGIWRRCATRPPASDRLEATSPRIALAFSTSIKRVTALAASAESPRVSRVTTLIGRPKTPPAWFASSTARRSPNRRRR